MSEQAPSPWDPPPAVHQPEGMPSERAQSESAQPVASQQPLAPPGAFPPPPGTQYGTVQYGSPQFGGAQYGAGQYPQPGAGYPGTPYPPNYGQYGPGPYGYGVASYGPPPGTNGMAIASLILGICGFFCITPLIGLGLGIGALAQTSKTRQDGRGMAIAGIILSTAWILLAALLIATGHVHSLHGTNSGPSTGPGQDGTSA